MSETTPQAPAAPAPRGEPLSHELLCELHQGAVIRDILIAYGCACDHKGAHVPSLVADFLERLTGERKWPIDADSALKDAP